MVEDIFIKDGKQIDCYNSSIHRNSMNNFYLSERVSLEYVLPKIKTITDIGCLMGDAGAAIKGKYDIEYLGIDVDLDAIKIGQEKYSWAKFVCGDFQDKNLVLPKSDLVIAFNLFDHFADWKKALKNIKRFSSRFINFSSQLRFSGNTVIDPDLSYIYYSDQPPRLLWIVHNIWELTSYCATENINAKNIFVYCYQKYKNSGLLPQGCHPLAPEEIYIGNIVIEFDDEKNMGTTTMRPDLKIIKDDMLIFDSPWINFKSNNFSIR